MYTSNYDVKNKQTQKTLNRGEKFIYFRPNKKEGKMFINEKKRPHNFYI